MSELGQLDTYYRLLYDYFQPDRLLSCAEGVFLSVVGVKRSGRFGGAEDDDNNNDINNNNHVGGGDPLDHHSTPGHHLWCVVSTVQSRVLIALLLYFFLCLMLIRVAWLLYGQHIDDLFIRSGIEQAQQTPQETQQQVSYDANPVKSSTKNEAKTD